MKGVIGAMFKLGVDLGYGYTKAVSETGKRVLFASLVGSGRPRYLGGVFGPGGSEGLTDDLDVMIDGREYFIGDLARRESRDASRAFEQDKAAHPNTKVLLATAAALLADAKLGPVHLATGLPLRYYAAQKDRFKQVLEAMEAEVQFLSGPRKGQARLVKFSRITVFPQAAGAVYAALLNDGQGGPKKGAMVALVDIGYKTTDFIAFEIGERLRVREDLSGTIETGISDVHRAVQMALVGITKAEVDPAEVETAIKGGAIWYGGNMYDVAKIAEEARHEVARAIKDRVTLAWGPKAKYFAAVYLAGGGAEELKPHLADYHPAQVIVPEAQFANALGFLKVAEMLERR